MMIDPDQALLRLRLLRRQAEYDSVIPERHSLSPAMVQIKEHRALDYQALDIAVKIISGLVEGQQEE